MDGWLENAKRLLTAHEFKGKEKDQADMWRDRDEAEPSNLGAYHALMDLHNNEVGFETALTREQPILIAVTYKDDPDNEVVWEESGEMIEVPDRVRIKDALLNKIETGEMLIWDGSEGWSSASTNRFLIYSNGQLPDRK